MNKSNLLPSRVQRYQWDDINRLKSACGVSTGATYKYRADGMRVQKISGLSIEWIEPEEASPYYDENQNQDFPTVRYYYDGQMGVEEDHTYVADEQLKKDVKRYGIGARGIDWISFSANGGGAVIGFPIYDGHGNMLYTLKRETGNDFSLNNRKVYDVWGGLRNGSGGAEQEHCASLGHRVDAESDLIYMRARYYEPWTGRFISEDTAMDGMNWFIYCGNEPILGVDADGEKVSYDSYAAIGFALYFLSKFFRGTNQDNGTFWRHVTGAIVGGLVGSQTTRVSNWLERAATRIAALMRLDKMKYPAGQIAYTRSQIQGAFWIGYAISLLVIDEYLTAWASGEER